MSFLVTRTQKVELTTEVTSMEMVAGWITAHADILECSGYEKIDGGLFKNGGYSTYYKEGNDNVILEYQQQKD